MILDGKYIIVNKNNYKMVINILKRFGYNDEYSMIEKLDDRKYVIISDPFFNIFLFSYETYMKSYFNYYECFNINKILREYKLKRILGEI